MNMNTNINKYKRTSTNTGYYTLDFDIVGTFQSCFESTCIRIEVASILFLSNNCIAFFSFNFCRWISIN